MKKCISFILRAFSPGHNLAQAVESMLRRLSPIKTESHVLTLMCHSFSYRPSTLGLAEASSYRAAVRTARGVVADLGEAATSASPGLCELSKVSEGHSERDGHNVVAKKFGLTLPVRVTELQKSPGMTYPGRLSMLRLVSWFKFLVEYNAFHVLCGLQQANKKREGHILAEFWRRYRIQNPDHPMWHLVDSGLLDPSHTAPLLLHGDEGRSRKRAAVLVLSWHSALGLGTEAANRERKSSPYLSMKLNYLGPTHTSRMLAAVLPRMTKDAEALTEILKVVAQDAKRLMFEGVPGADGKKRFAVCIGAIGDWAWLMKAGNLSRGYTHCIKRPQRADANPVGICHLCSAGMRDIPFEHLTSYKRYERRDDATPTWWHTRFSQSAFAEPVTPLREIPWADSQPESFYHFDLFHCFHLGLGRYFIAGALVLASENMCGSRLPDRFDELSQLYLAWCEAEHKSPFLISITQAKLNWQDTSQYPAGLWTKGHVTTSLCHFFESWAALQGFPENSLLHDCLEACRAIRKAVRILYSRDVWLSQEDALEAANSGLKFVSLYGMLALKSWQQSRALFPHVPKEHGLEHLFFELRYLAKRHEFTMNPAVFSCQMDEDYIGRVSRVTRRTSAQQVVQRTIERSLQAAFAQWSAAGYIKS